MAVFGSDFKRLLVLVLVDAFSLWAIPHGPEVRTA
jgi:hypothetical protein